MYTYVYIWILYICVSIIQQTYIYVYIYIFIYKSSCWTLKQLCMNTNKFIHLCWYIYTSSVKLIQAGGSW